MLAPIRTSAPGVPVVSFDEADQWLRTDGDEGQRALVEGLIASATARLDGWSGILGRCLVNQGWTVAFSCWPASRVFRLPFPDVSAVEVTYFDVDNAEQTVDAGSYAILHDANGSFIRLSSEFASPALNSDRGDAVQVTLTAGYGAAGTDVPAPIRTAILLMVSHWFHNREAVADSGTAELPLGVNDLIAPYRRVGV